MTGIIRMCALSTVLVYEYFSGGGCPPGDLPSGLAAEALGMVWSLLTDFRRWGSVRTIALLDPRFESHLPGLNGMTLPAGEVIPVSHGEHENTFLSLLKQCDSALVLAPETDGILARFTEYVEKAGMPLLGSSAIAIDTAGNKAACDRLFRKAHLSTPETYISDFASASRYAEQMGFPLVIKPLDGIGAEGVCLVKSVSDMSTALEHCRKATIHAEILLQSYQEGNHASVSLLVAGDRVLPLSLNLQLITPGVPFLYSGSQVPFHHKMECQALELARSAVRLVPGLKGYVGVDLVMTDNGVQLIEINPRLTTSYIGLRQVVRTNLAQAIWDACLNDRLPDHIELDGQVVIRKDDPASWGK
jgi:tyramine---L-glutamate ligase